MKTNASKQKFNLAIMSAMLFLYMGVASAADLVCNPFLIGPTSEDVSWNVSKNPYFTSANAVDSSITAVIAGLPDVETGTNRVDINLRLDNPGTGNTISYNLCGAYRPVKHHNNLAEITDNTKQQDAPTMGRLTVSHKIGTSNWTFNFTRVETPFEINTLMSRTTECRFVDKAPNVKPSAKAVECALQ